MALLYRDKDGNETPIAGTQVTGELVPSVSHYKSGTFQVTYLEPGVTNTGTVTFDETMPDADYVVVFNDPSTSQTEYNYFDQTASGFKVRWTNHGSATMQPHNITWQAFKLMTEQSYQLDSDQITANKSNIAKLQEVQDWSDLVQASIVGWPSSITGRYCKAKRFGSQWEIFGVVSVAFTPSEENAWSAHWTLGIQGQTARLLVTNSNISGRSDSVQFYSQSTDGYVGFTLGNRFVKDVQYQTVITFAGLVG